MFGRLIPFIFLGIMIVIFAAGMILLSYLLILGAVIGMILFLIAWLKEKLFPNKNLVLRKKSRSGEIIDHDEKR